MSKKHRKLAQTANPTSAAVNAGGNTWDMEYRVISKDLIRVIVLNVIYLAGLLAVYYTNNQQHYLEHWFGKLFHW